MGILLFILAVFPGLFLSWYIWWRDKHEREPHKYLIACFVFGLLSVFPALLLEETGAYLGFGLSRDTFSTFIFAVCVIGFSEEFSKFLFLRFYIFPKKEFCEPMDGIVYSVIVGMGFATFENVLYVFDDKHGGIETALMRMILSVPAHASFAVLMGYFVGLAKFSDKNKFLKLCIGLLSATIIHGLFDFFLFQKLHSSLMIFTLVTFVIAIIMSRYMIHWHVENSPHNNGEDRDIADHLLK